MWESLLCDERLGYKTWPSVRKSGRTGPSHILLAFFVRFVSNDKAMDPKKSLTILSFALAKFVSARNHVNALPLTRIVRDLTSP
jgi:hypothetical protein